MKKYCLAQDSGFKIQKGKYESAFQKKVPDFTNQSICPQQSYYKAFTSHKNFHSPMQGLFAKIL